MYILTAALVGGKQGKTPTHLKSPHSNTNDCSNKGSDHCPVSAEIAAQSGYRSRPTGRKQQINLPLLRPLTVAYSIAPYASVQKSVNTFGGSGESIMRCVKRMPIIPSAGSV